jgi:hypothetical protein
MKTDIFYFSESISLSFSQNEIFFQTKVVEKIVADHFDTVVY